MMHMQFEILYPAPFESHGFIFVKWQAFNGPKLPTQPTQIAARQKIFLYAYVNT